MRRVLYSSFHAPRSGTSATRLPARGPSAEHRVSVHHQDSVIGSGSGGGAPGGILAGGEENSWPPGTEAWTPRAAHTTTALCTGPRVPLSGRSWRTGSTCSLHPIRTRNASDTAWGLAQLAFLGAAVWEPLPACSPEGRKQAKHRSGGSLATRPAESRLPPSPPTSTGQNQVL